MPNQKTLKRENNKLVNSEAKVNLNSDIKRRKDFELEVAIMRRIGMNLTLNMYERLVKQYGIKYWPTVDGKILPYHLILKPTVKRYKTPMRKHLLHAKLLNKIFWAEDFLESVSSVDDSVRQVLPFTNYKNDVDYRINNYNKSLKEFMPEIKQIDYLKSTDKLHNVEAMYARRYLRSLERLASRRKCILHYKSTNSNYFITLTDMSYNVIGSFTTGRLTSSNMKKRKISPLLIYPLMNKIVKLLEKHRIRHICLHFKSNINRYVYNSLNVLKRRRYKIDYIAFLRPIPHHFGQRKKKPRRI